MPDLNSEIIIVDGHTHEQFFWVDKTFVLPSKRNQVYELVVKARDHNENETKETIKIFVN